MRCGKELPNDANYCIQCGASQNASVKEPWVEYIRRDRTQKSRLAARVMPAIFGAIALFMLIVMAVRFRVDVADDFSWWLAVVGAIGAIVIPQVLFPWLWKRQDSDRS